MTPPINPRFAEPVFRKWETDIHTAMTRGSVTVDPKDRGFTTTSRCAQSLRDAMFSFREYVWTSPIDLTGFVKWQPTTVVRELRDGTIWLGPRSVKPRQKDQPTPIVFPSPTPVDSLDTITPTEGELTMLCQLAANKTLNTVLRIKTVPELVERMEGRFDVAFELVDTTNCVYELR